MYGPGRSSTQRAFALGCADVFGKVQIAGEIEFAGLGLGQVPEDSGAERVQAEGAHVAHAVAPVSARDAPIMHVAGADDEAFAIHHEAVRLGGECVRSAALRAGCERRLQQAGEKLSAIGGWVFDEDMDPFSWYIA
jgi:hypothetical protein